MYSFEIQHRPSQPLIKVFSPSMSYYDRRLVVVSIADPVSTTIAELTPEQAAQLCVSLWLAIEQTPARITPTRDLLRTAHRIVTQRQR